MKAQLPKIAQILSAAKMTRAFVSLVRDPQRLDLVFALGKGIEDRPDVYGPIIEHLRGDPTSAAGLAQQPRLTVDMDALRALPAGTLGHEFARFIDEENLDPDELFRTVSIDKTERGEAAWLFEHLYETHDIWHVVTGFGTDEASEIGLQAFYLAQFPARLAMLLIAAGTLNTFLFNFEHRAELMDRLTTGWTMGKRAQSFVGIDWNTLWDTDLQAVRQQLGVIPVHAAKIALAA